MQTTHTTMRTVDTKGSTRNEQVNSTQDLKKFSRSLLYKTLKDSNCYAVC